MNKKIGGVILVLVGIATFVLSGGIDISSAMGKQESHNVEEIKCEYYIENDENIDATSENAQEYETCNHYEINENEEVGFSFISTNDENQ